MILPRGRCLASMLAASAIALAALLLRFSVLEQVFTPLGLIFAETDPFYHARRIALAMHDFPHVIAFDPYVNFPEGARIIWPLGFDLIMAALGSIAGGFRDPDRGLAACAIAVPFLALASVAATGLLAQRIAGSLAGFSAATLMAILPSQVTHGVVGRIDHHVLEPALFATAWLAFLRAEQCSDGRARDRWAVLCGAVMALAFWIVTTAILIPVFLAGGMILQRVLGGSAPPGRARPGRAEALVFATAAVLLVPFVLSSPFGRAGEFTYLGLSWFQETAVVVAGTAVLAVQGVLAAGKRARRAAFAGMVGLVGLGVVLLLGGGPDGGIAALREPLSFLFRRDPLLGDVAESQSPLTGGWAVILGGYTAWIFLAPLLWVALIVEARRERFENPGNTLLVAILPLAGAFYLIQSRFGQLFAVPLAAITGWAIEKAWRRIRGGQGRSVLALATIVLAAVTPPIVAWQLRPSWFPAGRLVGDATVRAYLWVRDHTPPTRGFDDPRLKPEYGIVSNWDRGHHLTWFARRPNVANPFGQAPWHVRGAVRAARILLDLDPARAAKRCDDLSVRYLAMEARRGEISSIATVAKGPRNAFASRDIDADGSIRLKVLPPYFQTLHARLALFDGEPIPWDGQTLPAIAGFRLIYESPEPGEFPVFARGRREPIVPRLVKIFERVRGAALEGMCEAGSPVEAFVEVQTNAGRRFIYSTAAACGPSGRFRMRVPYAESVSGDTGALGGYLLRHGVRRTNVLVTESDVEEGRTIRVKGWGA